MKTQVKAAVALVGMMAASGVSANSIQQTRDRLAGFSQANAPSQVVQYVNESTISAKVIDRQNRFVPSVRRVVQTGSAEQIKNTL